MDTPIRITRTMRTLMMALASNPAEWCHGYELSRETGIASGTLYPLLIRLSGQGLLETRWEAVQPDGRPPRHLYRLSTSGRAYARQLEGSHRETKLIWS